MTRNRDSRGRFTSNKSNYRTYGLRALGTVGTAAMGYGGKKLMDYFWDTAKNKLVRKSRPNPKHLTIDHKVSKKKKKEVRKPRKMIENPGSQSQTGFRHQFRKARRKDKGKYGWKYIQQGDGSIIVSCANGKQNSFTMPGILTVPQMTSVSATDSNKFDCLPWDLNPFSYTTGSALFTAQNTGTTTFYEDRVHLSAVTGWLDIINTSGMGIAYVDLYWLVANHPEAADPTTLFGYSITNDSFPATAAVSGQVAGTQPTSTAAFTHTPGYPSTTTYGMKPFQFPTFMKFYKILKKENMVLAAGEQRRTYLSIGYNEDQKKDEWLNFAGITKPGRTVYPFVIIKGGVAIVKDANGAVPERLSYAPVEVCANYCYTYHWKGVPNPSQRLSYTRLNGYFLNDTAANAVVRYIDDSQIVKQMDTGTGAVTTQSDWHE